MPTIKNYTRADRLDDFVDAMSNFSNGGVIDGVEFESIKSPGAIDKLWDCEIRELVEMNQIGSGSLKWKPLSEEENRLLITQLEQLDNDPPAPERVTVLRTTDESVAMDAIKVDQKKATILRRMKP